MEEKPEEPLGLTNNERVQIILNKKWQDQDEDAVNVLDKESAKHLSAILEVKNISDDDLREIENKLGVVSGAIKKKWIFTGIPSKFVSSFEDSLDLEKGTLLNPKLTEMEIKLSRCARDDFSIPQMSEAFGFKDNLQQFYLCFRCKETLSRKLHFYEMEHLTKAFKTKLQKQKEGQRLNFDNFLMGYISDCGYKKAYLFNLKERLKRLKKLYPESFLEFLSPVFKYYKEALSFYKNPSEAKRELGGMIFILFSFKEDVTASLTVELLNPIQPKEVFPAYMRNPVFEKILFYCLLEVEYGKNEKNKRCIMETVDEQGVFEAVAEMIKNSAELLDQLTSIIPADLTPTNIEKALDLWGLIKKGKYSTVSVEGIIRFREKILQCLEIKPAQLSPGEPGVKKEEVKIEDASSEENKEKIKRLKEELRSRINPFQLSQPLENTAVLIPKGERGRFNVNDSREIKIYKCLFVLVKRYVKEILKARICDPNQLLNEIADKDDLIIRNNQEHLSCFISLVLESVKSIDVNHTSAPVTESEDVLIENNSAVTEKEPEKLVETGEKTENRKSDQGTRNKIKHVKKVIGDKLSISLSQNPDDQKLPKIIQPELEVPMEKLNQEPRPFLLKRTMKQVIRLSKQDSEKLSEEERRDVDIYKTLLVSTRKFIGQILSDNPGLKEQDLKYLMILDLDAKEGAQQKNAAEKIEIKQEKSRDIAKSNDKKKVISISDFARFLDERGRGAVKELANRLGGISVQNIYKWKRGERSIPFKYRACIVEYLNTLKNEVLPKAPRDKKPIDKEAIKTDSQTTQAVIKKPKEALRIIPIERLNIDNLIAELRPVYPQDWREIWSEKAGKIDLSLEQFVEMVVMRLAKKYNGKRGSICKALGTSHYCLNKITKEFKLDEKIISIKPKETKENPESPILNGEDPRKIEPETSNPPVSQVEVLGKPKGKDEVAQKEKLDQSRAQKLLKEAKELAKNGEYEKALGKFEESQKIYPLENVKGYIQVVKKLIADQPREKTEEMKLRLTKQFNDALRLADQGCYTEAVKTLRQILEEVRPEHRGQELNHLCDQVNEAYEQYSQTIEYIDSGIEPDLDKLRKGMIALDISNVYNYWWDVVDALKTLARQIRIEKYVHPELVLCAEANKLIQWARNTRDWRVSLEKFKEAREIFEKLSLSTENLDREIEDLKICLGKTTIQPTVLSKPLSEPKRPATIITKDEVAQKEDAKKIVAVEVANESSEKANQVEIVQAKQKPPIESQVEINKEKKPTLEPVITKKRKEIPKVEYSKVEVIEPIIKEVTKLVELSLAPEPPKIAEEAKKEKTVSIATTIDQIKSIQDDIELKEMLASLYSEKDIEEVKKFEKVTRSQVVQFVIRRLSENQLSIRNAMCLAASFTKRQGKAFGIFNFEKLIKELKGCDDKTIDKVIEPIKQGKNIDEIVNALYGEDEL